MKLPKNFVSDCCGEPVKKAEIKYTVKSGKKKEYVCTVCGELCGLIEKKVWNQPQAGSEW